MKGRIHSMESMGTLDGPGIRFVLFMQGCILKCKYCHNRDTWDARLGKQVSADEIVKKVLRCKPFMDASGGGITVSGGEALLQAEFVHELFTKLHKYNIHTCLDTSGNVEITPEIEELLKETDLVLLDIKHINDKKCRELVGLSNKNELAFARYLDEHNIPVWIRQVLVPGFTDDEEDLKELKRFINTLNNVQKFEFLLYHDLGKYKWIDLGKEYPLEGVRTANNDDLEKALKVMESVEK